MHEETRFLNILLMFIGGSPGGTAGGVKTTTIAMLMLHALHLSVGDRIRNVLEEEYPHKMSEWDL